VEPTERGRHALIITYTVLDPAVMGVFFRALRLTLELHRRGWSTTICNFGPIPIDPKVTRVRELARVVEIDFRATLTNFNPPLGIPGGAAGIAKYLSAFEPDVVIFGEGPLGGLKPVFEAANAMPQPLVLLEQYYGDWLMTRDILGDLVLVYGLKCFWADQLPLPAPFMMVPPFIGELLPRDQLPVPAHAAPWLTVLGFEPRVLRAGLEIARQCEAVLVSLSHDPELARRLAAEAGVAIVALPLQPDTILFSLIRHSRCVVLANGMMQLMEALSLGCPAVCIHRGGGLDAFMVDERFQPYVSIEDSLEDQVKKVRGWLKASPFSAELLTQLDRERNGAAQCVDVIERVHEFPARRRPTFWRKLASKLRSREAR